MVQDYITKSIGPSKRVMITYGPNARSRGIATIIFGTTALGHKSVQVLNGVKIDGRLVKVFQYTPTQTMDDADENRWNSCSTQANLRFLRRRRALRIACRRLPCSLVQA